MDAIISDIHGNLEAMEAVLAACDRHGAARIICLGDAVGYGPNPVECADRLLKCSMFISGEWDIAAAAPDPPNWMAPLAEHLAWVRAQFASSPEGTRILRSLAEHLLYYREVDECYFHGSPSDPKEWIFPEDIYCRRKMDRIAAEAGRLSFCGHSHIAGLFAKFSGDEWGYTSFDETGDEWVTLRSPSICSVGSVGQPRDGDPRAAFVLRDGERVRFIRVEYDIETTAAKIRSIAEIDSMHADRLFYGR